MEKEVLKDLERVFQQYFNIAGAMSSLSLSKQRILERGLQQFDKETIASELNSIAAKVQELGRNVKHLSDRISEL
ncbi:MAG: hypothetical protein ACM34K_14080 [Bacillota bacterium]